MEVNWMSEVEMKDFVCEQCDLEFTREKDYFEGREEYCYCCENEEHYVVLGDIRMSDMQETDDGFYVEDVGCKYCEKKVSLEFTHRDNAVLMSDDDATWETGHSSIQISFGDAD
jgi:hypothetical protein